MSRDANDAFDPFAGSSIVATAASTESQREIWTATRIGPEASLAFNESITLRFAGALDLGALEAATNEIQCRHEALRTVFSADGLTQLVTSTLAPMQRIETTPAGFAALLARAVETPFELEEGPLLRFELARLGPEDHRLIFTAHHIVCDGWSSGVLVRELAALYSASLRGAQANLPKAISFIEYSRAAPDQAQLAGDEAYWLGQFEGELPILELPTDRPRPALKTFRAHREDLELDAGLVGRLRAAASTQRASLFTLLLAAFEVLLHRLTAQEDLVVGIPAAGQAALGAGTLVGHCVNTLPLRTKLQGGLRFSELVATLRGTMLDGLEHQQLTLGALLRKLPVVRDPSRLPLVSVAFNLDRALLPPAYAFEGIQTSLETNPRSFENFDLFVNAVERPDSVMLECQYNADLFDAATVRRWLLAYGLVLGDAASNPAAPIGSMALVPAEDALRIAAWNEASKSPYPADLCAHELFELQAARTPQAVAVEFAGKELTYAALDARANALAHRLRAAGVRRGSLVGHCVERSFELFVALLGILKAGGAYVPLDPDYPLERLSYMVADSAMRLIVSQRKLLALLSLGGAEVVYLEDVELSALPVSKDESSATPQSPAYVLYTSGSTGKPKGVLVPHRALVNLLTSVQQTPGMSAPDVVLAITTLSFDIAASEILLPLTVGARIVLATRDLASDGPSLLRLIRSQKVTFVDATPATWRLLLGAGWEGGEGLKAICTGEAMPRELAEEIRCRTASLWNGYGPTETTVWSTFWEVPRKLDRVLIGKPVANTQAHVLDVRLQQVPIGVPGELYLGGDGVSLGYLNRPELTAQRFVETALGRLYRTGDLVRWLSDGNLECLGRTDNQVKLRGFRIELGEIEDALAHHPAVRAAAVIKREDVPGNARLVAYLTLRDDGAANDAQLRAFLKATLPDYMIPAAFVRLGALPLTPSGKIDRKALPAPSAGPSSAAADFIAPRTPAEELVAGLWKEALGVGRLSANDDFFALGGHSLLASQVLARLSRDHGVELSFRTLFEAPVLSAFAALVEQKELTGGTSTPSSIPCHEGPVPLSLAQERLWLLEELDGHQRLVHALPAAWRLRGPLDRAVLERCLQEISDRHETLRTSVRLEGGQPVQAIAESVPVTLPFRELSDEPAPQEALTTLLEVEARRTYDLSQPQPLFRALLVRVGPEDHALFIQPHNLIWDGWSFDLFLRELSALYPALAQGKSSPLEPLQVRYRDYAVWHRGRMSTPESESQIAWWRARLESAPPTLELPADHRRKLESDLLAGNRGIQLPRADVDALTALARENGATLFMVLYAAFNVLLHRLTGETDLLVGTPVRGRSRPELEDLIGPFINAVVLRTQLSPSLTFRELLARVRETTLDSFSHQDVPLEALGPNAPAVRVFFSLQDARARAPSIGPCTVQQLHVLPPASATDLMLWMMETSTGLLAMANYRADLFEAETIERFLRQFRSVFSAILRTPDAPIGALQLTGPSDPPAPAAVSRPSPAPRPLLERLAELAAAGAVAALEGARVVTARELEARANGLAHLLIGRGLAPGARVGLLLPAGADLLIGLFGCWKAGLVAVPLDPESSAQRRSALRTALRLELVLSHSQLEPGALDVSTVPESSQPPAERQHQVAVVLTLQGATGLQELAIPHARLASLAAGVASELGLTSADLVVSTAASDADSFLLECLAPLSAGARLMLASSDPELLASELARASATCLFASGQLLRLLTTAGWKPPPGMRLCATGGPLPESLEPAHADGVAIRVYLEAQLATLIARGSDAFQAARAGAPVPGVEASIRGPGLTLASFGELGDLALDGVLTGDRARLVSGGSVEVARPSEQRAWSQGGRVDLAAVEAALARQAAVAQSAVGVTSGVDGMLVAWVVWRSAEARPTATELRRELRRSLPESAVPRLFLELPSLPLRADGSIDRARLPSPPGALSGPEFVEPRTNSEKLLAAIWREALRIERVGVYDRFFDIGGHSLLAFEVIARLEQQTGQRLSPRVLLLSSLEQAAAGLEETLQSTSQPSPAAQEPFAARMLRRLKGIVRAR